MREAFRKLEASRDIDVWEAADRRFHKALLQGCAMPRLMAAIGDPHRVAARYLFATWEELDSQAGSDKGCSPETEFRKRN